MDIPAISNASMLASMEVMRSQASMGKAPQGGHVSFGGVLKDAIQNVNTTQLRSSDASRRFIAGDPTVSMAEVVALSQQSSIAFEATKQTRNKMVEAYKDILSLQL